MKPNERNENEQNGYLVPFGALSCAGQGNTAQRENESTTAQEKRKKSHPQQKPEAVQNEFKRIGTPLCICKITIFQRIGKARYFFSLLFVWIVDISNGTAPPQCGHTTEGGGGAAHQPATPTQREAERNTARYVWRFEDTSPNGYNNLENSEKARFATSARTLRK